MLLDRNGAIADSWTRADGAAIGNLAQVLVTWDMLPEPRRAAIAGSRPAVMPQFAALLRETGHAEALARLTLPALLPTGSRTAASTRRSGALMRGLAPDAWHETMTGLGHMGPLTHAERVNTRIAAFLHGLHRTVPGVQDRHFAFAA